MGVLDGRIALVTGASRGIGAAVAKRFAQEGAAVVVTARTEEQRDSRLPGTIHETADAIKASGGIAVAIRADLAKAEDRVFLVQEAQRTLGDPDILVNNAAVTWFYPTPDFPDGRFRTMFEVQVHAPFELSKLVLPAMRRRRRGWILNISSGASRRPQGPPFSISLQRAGTMYGVCKAALERLSVGLAAEVYEDGVAVNSLAPTMIVRTPGVMAHELFPSDPDFADHESVESVAEAALVLCSGNPKLMTARNDYSQELLAEFGTHRELKRVLQTVLFADIVSSTQRAAELGDERWRQVLDAHDALAARIVEQHQGSLVKSTGDGVLATFDGPARGVRCARDLIAAAKGGLDISMRAGLHTGELELRGDDVAGIAVHLAHRVCDLAPAGSVFVSRTVVDLVFGSELRFSEGGEHDLKGVPGRWTLHELV